MVHFNHSKLEPISGLWLKIRPGQFHKAVSTNFGAKMVFPTPKCNFQFHKQMLVLTLSIFSLKHQKSLEFIILVVKQPLFWCFIHYFTAFCEIDSYLDLLLCSTLDVWNLYFLCIWFSDTAGVWNPNPQSLHLKKFYQKVSKNRTFCLDLRQCCKSK